MRTPPWPSTHQLTVISFTQAKLSQNGEVSLGVCGGAQLLCVTQFRHTASLKFGMQIGDRRLTGGKPESLSPRPQLGKGMIALRAGWQADLWRSDGFADESDRGTDGSGKVADLREPFRAQVLVDLVDRSIGKAHRRIEHPQHGVQRACIFGVA